MKVPFNSGPTQRCLVYDKRSGRVVHIHDFIGADPSSSISLEEMEKQALEYAGDIIDKQYLAVVEVEGDFQATGTDYKVDISTGEVIVTPSSQNPQS